MNNYTNMTATRGLKSKTIKALIRKKVDAWIDSIEDKDLRELCRKEAIVTGGSIASMLLGEPVNDYDIYFRTKETVLKVAEYYVNQFKKIKKDQGGIEYDSYVEALTDSNGESRVRVVVRSAGIGSVDNDLDYDYFEMGEDHDASEYVGEAFDPLSDVKDIADEVKNDLCDTEVNDMYQVAFLSSNAISLKGKIQLVLRFFGDPDEIHENFDFVHCMNYYEVGSRSLTLRPEALEALLSRNLVYHGSKYPLTSVIRTRKFIQRGWKINAGQYLKMAMQISELNLHDHVILEEQLTGVDVAYFAQIIERVRSKDPERVDSAYLTEIIDRMF